MTQETSAASRRTVLGRAATGALAFGAAAATRIAPAGAATTSSDIDPGILNFALNLEYLEGQFYSFAAFGHGLGSAVATTGPAGPVNGGAKIPFTTARIGQFINEVANDETNHVKFLVGALGPSAVPAPAIDFTNTFLALGNMIGLENFNPFADELSFLLGAYVFEDVGVTAYNGAAPLITSKTYLGAAASILAVEAYHASAIRTLITEFGGSVYADRISAIRAQLSGTGGTTGIPADDQGTLVNNVVNIVPTDSNSLAFARTPYQVLDIVFTGGTTSGGFFPKGIQGMFTSSVA